MALQAAPRCLAVSAITFDTRKHVKQVGRRERVLHGGIDERLAGVKAALVADDPQADQISVTRSSCTGHFLVTHPP
ncbi:MAG: hypothetical protein IPJ97_06115 [Proteobacteria bacterium]|nr:hypothetical protein [Pseudomonadota bacterium]